ncbi:MAG: hypothetical protein RIC95_10545 [Vicingaceae bacterium]
MNLLVNLNLILLNANDSLQHVSDTLSSESSSSWTSEQTYLLLFFIVVIGAIVHMVFSFKLKRFEPISLEEIKSKRRSESKDEEATEEENQLAMNYLEDVFEHWTLVSEEGEEELKAPTRKVHLEKSLNELDKVKDIAPTDPVVVDRLNELGDVINSNAKRAFSGSKALIAISVIFTAIFMYSIKQDNDTYLDVLLDSFWFWGSMLFYVVASYAPQFLIDKRLRKLGSSNFSSGLVGFFAGMFLSAPTFTTITKWSDGSKTSSTTFNIVGLFIMLIGLFFLAAFIILFGLLNYLRNYVLYL